MMLLYIISKEYDVKKITALKKPIYVFVAGFTFTVVNMMIIGIYDVVGDGTTIVSRAAMDGLSGIGHIILAIGLVSIVVRIFNNETGSNFVEN